jgi:23S rRNA pseudouridine1911/1915/1917 synthase
VTLRARLHAQFPGASGRGIKQWLEHGRVRVNGVVVRRGDVPVAADDRIELGAPPPEPIPPPLRLVHEDADVLVIDKPPGLLTIADASERERTVYRLLRDWLEGRDAGRVFVVHRLDRETSGLLVFARTGAAKAALQRQFAARTPERRYVARIEGAMPDDSGTLTTRLVQDRGLRVRSTRDARAGREAITRYRVLTRETDSTLVELTLVTGRRAQIRAQLAELGHPIVGDRAFGSRRDPLRRVCLHATRLGFVHPDGRRMAFDSPPPSGFRLPPAGRRPGREPSRAARRDCARGGRRIP